MPENTPIALRVGTMKSVCFIRCEFDLASVVFASLTLPCNLTRLFAPSKCCVDLMIPTHFLSTAKSIVHNVLALLSLFDFIIFFIPLSSSWLHGIWVLGFCNISYSCLLLNSTGPTLPASLRIIPPYYYTACLNGRGSIVGPSLVGTILYITIKLHRLPLLSSCLLRCWFSRDSWMSSICFVAIKVSPTLLAIKTLPC